AKVIGVVACDLPYAEPKLISWLAKKLTYAEAVIPVVNGEPQPLHAVYARSCLPKLVAQLESHDKSVMAFLNQIKAIYVPEVEWQVIADTRCLKVHINEPEDLVHWQACEIELKSSNVP
ncbi:MAG: NTP transferase domain-containing protein, partial [Armatimonadota bacterium]|nr:NTP transferase domain-containing protein [Armatimonadota bacterium]